MPSCQFLVLLAKLLDKVDNSPKLDNNDELVLPGGVPEWSKGSDCKSDGYAFAGSNPAPSNPYRLVCFGW